MLKNGVITKNISNLYVVDTDDGRYEVTPRGKFRFDKIVPVVGDNVVIDIETKSMVEISVRDSYLERPSVANIKYALIVTSVKKPDLSLQLLDRMIVRFESKNIIPILIFTKTDLLSKDEVKNIKEVMKYYKKIGYNVLVNTKINKIKKLLKGKIAFLVGQTGAGKSTLLNNLDKSLSLKTGEISEALGRGKHTTRHTELFKISNFYVVDTPGFSSLNLDDIDKNDLKNCFVEFLKYNCDFKDCNHLEKENCVVRKMALNNVIRTSRYDNYLKFYEEINESSSKLYK